MTLLACRRLNLMDEALHKAPRADVMSVNADDHDRWALHGLSFQYEMLPVHMRNYHPERDNPESDLGPGYYDEYVPLTYDVEGGEVLKKTVKHETLVCPDCDEVGRKDEQGLPVCPECGLVLRSSTRPMHEVVIDPKAAGRVDNDGEFIQ